MKTRIGLLGILVLALGAGATRAAEWFVATNGNDAAAGTNWATAKLTIQAGVDAATAGDTVWVGDGTYAAGGRPVADSSLTNRVAIDKAITVQSVNGPAATIIQGEGGWLGDDAVRCVYLGTNAALNGFMLTNGHTRLYDDNRGGGIWSEVSGVVSNCILTGNVAFYGGGANGGILIDCTLSGNDAEEEGGGARGATLTRCVIRDNFVDMSGGGASGCTLADCALIGNVCGFMGGGGANDSDLVNCTVVSNRGNNAGGVSGGIMVNSIVYGNLPTNVPNHTNAAFSYSCTTPDPGGTGNVTADPRFVDAGAGNYRLLATSPCINAGDNGAVLDGADLDGNPRIALGSPFGRVDMGAFEIASQVRYVATNGSDAADGMSWATAKQTIQAAVDSAGGGDVAWVSNGVYAAGGRAMYGGMTNRVAIDRPIAVSSVNGPAATILRGGVATRCAYVGTNAMLAGFTLTNGATWNDEFSEHERGRSGSGVWCENSGVVSNCVLSGNTASSYGGGAYGGILRNCTLRGNSASWGGGAHGSTLWACEISGNSVALGGSGGGLNSCTANLCVVSGNRADLSGGGGAFESTLNNCVVVDNQALIGGGTYGGTAHNCTLVGNWAGSGLLDDGTGGGGSAEGTLVNCIVYGNGVPVSNSGSNYLGGAFQYSCTAPHPGGTGNIDADPQFAGAGNYRLQATSPCIDAGDNSAVAWDEDLDGNQRIVYGAVDMGVYEAQLAGAGTWFNAITNGLTGDLDCAAGDGVPNLLKYATGGSPRISDDMMLVGGLPGGAGPMLTFNRNPNATDVRYVVESADRMADEAAWRGVATNVGGSWLGATNVEESGTGNPVECTVTDPVALDSNRFLRLRVSRP
mgnify:CR=1 FL=1